MTARRAWGTRLTALVGSLLLVIGVLGLLVPAARADSAPLDPTDPATPTTVTADALPTVQINGVAWSQVVVGNTVYVAGKFSTARPAGAAAGTRETVRNNLLAYDIRTGELVTSFTPDLNAQALAIAASPDGKRIYVAGDFNRANGQVRSRIAAYDTATGALVAAFKPSVAGQIRALAATNSTVYLGGNVSAVGSVSRTRLAAVSAATGALLPWAPVPGAAATAGSNEVLSLVVTGGGTQVVVAGRFATLNRVAATGVGALEATGVGATKPFAVNKLITNQGPNSAIWSLSTDGTTVYGSAYDFGGPGNLEGTFAADANGGALRSVAYCRGDNYSNFASNGALYIASHMHDCGYVGGYPEQSPRVHMHATAFSLAATGKVVGSFRNTNFVGKPAPSLLPWFPTMAQGSYTGQLQAGWSVTGNSQYVVYGGEFPRVNGVGQQGLVRYAMPALAPNKVGPGTAPAPTATAIAPGAVRIGWKASSDQDNERLTYRVYRDGDAAMPVAEFTRPSTWWQTPGLAFTDRAVPAGTHTYRVTVSDPAGNLRASPWVSATATAGGSARPYAATVHADGAIDHWSLGETSGTTAYDQAGTSDATIGTGVTRGAAGAISGDNDRAMTFNGSIGLVATKTVVPGPQVFSVEAWFQTTSKAGGKIVGFGNAKTGISTTYDRHVFMTTTGRVSFGVNDGARRTITSPGAYNDGRWHHVVATMGLSGLTLFVDGTQVGRLAGVTEAQAYAGYWRIGVDGTWSGATHFAGGIDEVAIYPTALTAAQVTAHHAQGSTGAVANAAPTAAFTTSVTDLTAAFDGSSSTDRDGSVAGHAWNFGDATTGSGVTASHTYRAAGTYSVVLTVTDDDGKTALRTESVTVTAPPPNSAPDARFTTSVGGRAVTVDASGSSDRDGTVATYTWAFGDGRSATGPTATHVYAASGTYTVTLTLTDDDGATATATLPVTVAGAPVIAADGFDRSVTGGLGAAEVGGAWTVAAGATRQSVAESAATFALTPATNTGSYLGSVAPDSADVRTTMSLSGVPTGGGAMVYVTGRRVAANLEYRARVRVLADGSVGVAAVKLTGTTTETLIGSEVLLPGLTYTPGLALNVRLAVSGSGTTDLAATVWAEGTTEPATPTLTRTDATAELQAPGGLGMAGYLAGSATAPVDLRFTGLTVTPVGGGNSAPTAAFTSAGNGLTASFNASTSKDTDGTLAGYAWDFGDGTTGQGATVSHTYAAAGTYTVRLTVTDDEGATAFVERPVTATAPAAAVVLAADEFDRSVTGGLGTAGVGGAWTASAGATRQSVAASAARFAMTAGTNTGSFLGSVARTDADVRTTLSLSGVPTGGGANVYVIGRRVAANQEYRGRVRILADGSVRVAVVRMSGSTTDVLVGSEVLVAGLTYKPGMELNVRVRVSGTGTTQLAATVWAVGSAEPATPTVSRTDSTAELQAAGSVGLTAYLSGSATAPVELRFAGFSATDPQD
jgi:PKD repeat protein